MGTDGHIQTIREAAQLRLAGKLAEATALLHRALEAPHNGNPEARADVLRELAEVHLRSGAWAAAHAALDEAVQLLGNEPHTTDAARWAQLMERRAWTLFREGKLRQAQTLAVNLRERLEIDTDANAALLAGIHNTLGGIAWNEGRANDALDHVSRAAQLFEKAGDHFGAANTRTNLGVLNFSQGKWSAAAEQFAASDRIRSELGWTAGRAANLLNLGVLEMSMGDHAHARVHFEEAIRLSQSAGERYDSSRAEIALAHLDLLESRVDEAYKHIDTALTDTSCIGEDDVVQASWLRALIECERTGVDSALEIAEQARRSARAGNMVDSEADCCRALAEAYRRSGQYEKAEELLIEAIDLSSRAGDPYRKALAQFELGVINELKAEADTQPTERRTRARENFDAAVNVFEQLGANHDLRRAQTARARVIG